MGSLNYMSPEQVSGRDVDQRSDLFAVGAVFYEFLAYRKAFPGGLPSVLIRILRAEPDQFASVPRRWTMSSFRSSKRSLAKIQRSGIRISARCGRISAGPSASGERG